MSAKNNIGVLGCRMLSRGIIPKLRKLRIGKAFPDNVDECKINN